MRELLHSLGINWPTMIAQVVNFAILLFVLSRFVYRPVMRLLDERREKIAETERQKRLMEEKLNLITAEREKVLAAARAESEKIIEAVKQNGEELRKKILLSAQEEAARIKTESEKQLAVRKDKLISDVRKEIGTLVVEAIEKSFGDVLDRRVQGKMVEQALAAIREDAKSSKNY